MRTDNRQQAPANWQFSGNVANCRLPVACYLFLFLCSCRPDPGPAIQVVGDSFKRRVGDPAPRTSPFFDGRAVRLRGVRGETLGVQVLLGKREATAVTLEVPSAAATVTTFALRAMPVEEPSTEMYGFGDGPGLYPDALEPQEGDLVAVDQAFFDVAILPSAPAGRYDGTLRVGEESFNVELVVEPLAIDLRAGPLVWVWYKTGELARQHGYPDDDNPEQLATERRYAELFRAHGAYLASDPYPARRLAVRRELMEGVRYWPVHVDDDPPEAQLAEETRQWLELFAGIPGVTPFVNVRDEPHTAEDRASARRTAEIIGKHGGGRPRYLRAVTARVHPDFGDAIDVYIAPWNIPAERDRLAGSGVRFWTYNGRPPEAGNMVIDTAGVALRTWGWIAWRYDVELWYAWEGLYFSDRYNEGGPTDLTTTALTFDQRRNTRMRGPRDWGNGEGVLAYPGARPSLRLKALRRGLQDRLLLRELVRCGGADEAAALAHRMVPRALGEGDGPLGSHSWHLDEPSWEAARRELIDLLLTRCPHEG
jgi:hypothetical protein